MTGPSYTAKPAAITGGSRAIQDLGSYAKNLASSTRSDLADTSWTGNDSYGQQLRKQFVQTRDTVLGAIDAIGEGIAAVGDGTLDNLRSIQGTQSGIIDAIHEQSGRTGSHT